MASRVPTRLAFVRAVLRLVMSAPYNKPLVKASHIAYFFLKHLL